MHKPVSRLMAGLLHMYIFNRQIIKGSIHFSGTFLITMHPRDLKIWVLYGGQIYRVA